MYFRVRSNFRVATVYQNKSRSRSYLTLQWEKGNLVIYDMQTGQMEKVKPSLDANGIMRVSLDKDMITSNCLDNANTSILRIIGLEGILLRHRQLLREATHKVSLSIRDKSSRQEELLYVLNNIKTAQDYLRKCDKKNFRKRSDEE